jgi:hypothetical protein
MKHIILYWTVHTMDESALSSHKIVTTYTGDGVYVLSDEQVAYYTSNPSSTIDEVINMRPTPVPTPVVYVSVFDGNVDPQVAYTVEDRHGVLYYVFNSVPSNVQVYKSFYSEGEYNTWLSRVIDIVSVYYDWNNSTAFIKCDDGRTYTTPCDSSWTDYTCENYINGVQFEDNPVIVIPTEMAGFLSNSGYTVKKICYSDVFNYTCSTVQINGIEVVDSFVQLCPIDFNSFDAGDAEIIETLRSQWNANNPGRVLPETIMFTSRYSMFKYFNAPVDNVVPV